MLLEEVDHLKLHSRESIFIKSCYIYTKAFKLTTKTKKVHARLVESATTNSKRVHITPRINGWAVRKEANLYPTKILDTPEEAILIAANWVKSGLATSVIFHEKDGGFRAVI